MELDRDALQFIIICFSIGFVLIWLGIRKHKKLRLVQDHPTVKIETAAQGFSEVQGFAWPTAVGPKCVKGIEMIYHSLQLQKEVTQGSGKNKKKVWITVFSAGYANPFYVMDATGLALVDPGKSELEIESETTRRWSRLQATEKNHYLTHFIKGPIPGFPPSGFLFGLFSSPFRIVESRINMGSPVYIKGHFESPEGLQKEVMLTGLAKFATQVFDFQSRKIRQIKNLLDSNKDDNITSKEAIDGYSRLAMFAKTQSESGQSPVPDKNFLVFGLFTSNQDHKLFIADCHEEHLLRKLKIQFYGYLSAGLAMCLVSVFVHSPWLYEQTSRFRDVAVAAPVVIDSGALHGSCLSGQLLACKELMRNQYSLKLSDQYMKFYKKRACELGDVIYCR